MTSDSRPIEAAELAKAIREDGCCPHRKVPAFAKGSWQHAVDDQLVGYGKTSEEFTSPHDAVAWLLKQVGDAAAATVPEGEKALVWAIANVVTGVTRGAEREPVIGVEAAKKVIAMVRAAATVEVPDERCPACLGSEFPGWKRGVRCATCKGTATLPTPTAQKAEQQERLRELAGAIEQEFVRLEDLPAFIHRLQDEVRASRAAAGIRVLNALEVLGRMDYAPGDRARVENFLAILGRCGMFVIENPLAASGAHHKEKA